MKFSQLFFLFVLSILFVNCSNDDTPDPKPEDEDISKPEPEEPLLPVSEVYFSYYADPDETFAMWENRWVIIHNQDGEILDYAPFKAGDSLEFKGTEEKLKTTNTLSITTLNYRPKDGGGNFHIVATETGIGKTSIWGWSDEFEPVVPNPPITNSYPIKITVNNVPNVQRYDLTSQPYGLEEGTAFYQETETLEIFATLHQDTSYFLGIRDGNDDVRYKFIELPNPPGNITLEYIDFLEYDQVIEVVLPLHESYYASVWAKNKTINYVSGLTISLESAGNQTRSIAKLGYLDSFDTFFTDFSVSYNDHNKYKFYNVETRPDKIDVPIDPQFQVEYTTIFDFSFTTDVEYYRYISSWVYEDFDQDNTTIYSLSSKSEVESKIGTLPNEILEKYPNLNLENLNYEETFLYFGENIDFKSDNRTTLGGLFVPSGFEGITFENPED